jgi:tripartite-type tricarboxylate transporter receptor subunit TctC
MAGQQAFRLIGLVAVLFWGAEALIPPRAQAQDYPNRPITILVGVAPGGVTDVTTRIYAEIVSKTIGQRIVVENRPVGGGTVAAVSVQNAPPDGYTLLTITGSAHAAIPAMQPVAYDPIKGFEPITLLFRLPSLLIVPPDSPAKTVAELLALGKTKTGGLSFGSAGAGTPGHIVAAKIARATGTPMQYVQYRGGAALIADLITGRLDFSFNSYTSSRSNLDANKVRALAIDADNRLGILPEVPTLTEVGLGKERIANWFGLVGPAGMPAAIVQRLNEEFVKASRDPDLIRRLTSNGTLIATSTPQDMGRAIAEEVQNMAQLIPTLGLKVQ